MSYQLLELPALVIFEDFYCYSSVSVQRRLGLHQFLAPAAELLRSVSGRFSPMRSNKAELLTVAVGEVRFRYRGEVGGK